MFETVRNRGVPGACWHEWSGSAPTRPGTHWKRTGVCQERAGSKHSVQGRAKSVQGRSGMERNGSVPGTYQEMERSGSSCQEVCTSCRIDQVLEILPLQGRLRQQ